MFLRIKRKKINCLWTSSMDLDFGNTSNTTVSPLTTTTTAPNPHDVPEYIGLIGVCVSIIFLGSNFLPIKKYKTGDGMFFQLMLATGIWTVGFIVNAARGFPQFYALPMLGGFLWSTGNVNTVPIMKTIGLGLGTLFPNTVLLCLGWAIARFGKYVFIILLFYSNVMKF